MNLAVAGSSRNLGRGLSLIGRSEEKTGGLAGASGWSHSMMRLKNADRCPIRIPIVVFDSWVFLR